MTANRPLSHRLCSAYFTGVADPHLDDSMEQLLSSVRIEHHLFADGPLRQALCICYLSPVFKPVSDAWRGSKAIVRLQLANGLVFGLHLKGNVRPALDRLEQVGHWLALRPYAVDQFEQYDAGLADLINAGQPASDICEIRLARFASVAPLPGISRSMLLSMAFGAFNALRKRHGLRPLNRVPRLLAQHVVSHIAAAADTAEAYLAGLDQDALGVIRRFNASYHQRYDDLRAYNFFVAEHGKFCRNRVQAVQALPWLLRILSGMHSMHSYEMAPLSPARLTAPHVVEQILHAIDTGKPLFDSVARACEVPKETVRWTRHRMLPNVSQFAVSRVELLLKMLSWMPPEKRPRSNEDWSAMRDLVCTLLPVFPVHHDTAESAQLLLADPRYGNAMARWMRELMRPDLLGASRRLGRLRQAGQDPADARDYVAALLRALYRYCYSTRTRAENVLPVYHDCLLGWLSAKPLHQVLALSRQWHERVREETQQVQPRSIPEAPEDTAWPAVLPEPICIGQLRIVELVTADDLAKEGRAMEHCVGGYTWQCTAGDAMIVSIRHVDGRRLSTAELAIDGLSSRVSVRQHKGRANMPALKKCEQVLTEVVSVLNSSAYRDRLEVRRNFQSTRRYAHEALSIGRGAASDGVRRLEEELAWACTFGPVPVEESASLASIGLQPPAATGMDEASHIRAGRCGSVAALT